MISLLEDRYNQSIQDYDTCLPLKSQRIVGFLSTILLSTPKRRSATAFDPCAQPPLLHHFHHPCPTSLYSTPDCFLASCYPNSSSSQYYPISPLSLFIQPPLSFPHPAPDPIPPKLVQLFHTISPSNLQTTPIKAKVPSNPQTNSIQCQIAN